jgi:hypothetical protein
MGPQGRGDVDSAALLPAGLETVVGFLNPSLILNCSLLRQPLKSLKIPILGCVKFEFGNKTRNVTPRLPGTPAAIPTAHFNEGLERWKDGDFHGQAK